MYSTKAKIGDDDIKTIGNIHDKLVKFKSEIENDDCNDSQKFVIAKLLVQVVKHAKELDIETAKRDKLKLEFTRNTEITSYLSKEKKLGFIQERPLKIVRSPALKKKLPSATLPPKPQSPPSLTYDCDRNYKTKDVRPRLTRLKFYSVNDRQEFPIKLQDDKNTCDIYSSCVDDDGNVLLVDNLNANVKLVDGKTNSVKSSLTLNAKPLSVCVVSKTDAAVCLEGSSIQFVSTCDKLVATRSLLVSYGRKVIAASKEKIYIGMGSEICIYAMSGEKVKEIKNDKSGNALFSYINDIIVNDVRKMMYVADRHQGVIALDTDGNVVWKYSSEQLNGPLGICSDDDGNVLVCGLSSHNVIQLAPDGKYQGEVVTVGDKLENPKTICYSKKYRKIYIGRLNDNITVLSLR